MCKHAILIHKLSKLSLPWKGGHSPPPTRSLCSIALPPPPPPHPLVEKSRHHWSSHMFTVIKWRVVVMNPWNSNLPPGYFTVENELNNSINDNCRFSEVNCFIIIHYYGFLIIQQRHHMDGKSKWRKKIRQTIKYHRLLNPTIRCT